MGEWISVNDRLSEGNRYKGKVVVVYGVKLTEIESMKFSKYLSNNPKLPSPNTLQPEGRKQLVLDFLKGCRQ